MMRYGSIHRMLELVANHVTLNALWLIACVPIVTIPASTTAMFAIMRQWASGDEPPLLRRFVMEFRNHFLRSSLVGLVWLGVGALLVLDFSIVGQMGAMRRPLEVLLMSLTLLYALASAQLLPLMLTGTNGVRVAKSAVLISLARPHRAALSLLLTLAAAATAWTLPLLLLALPSLTAFAVTVLADRTLRTINSTRLDAPDIRPAVDDALTRTSLASARTWPTPTTSAATSDAASPAAAAGRLPCDGGA